MGALSASARIASSARRPILQSVRFAGTTAPNRSILLAETAVLRDRARELQTGFQAGHGFSGRSGINNFLRRSFAHYDENDIREGIARICPLFD